MASKENRFQSVVSYFNSLDEGNSYAHSDHIHTQKVTIINFS